MIECRRIYEEKRKRLEDAHAHIGLVAWNHLRVMFSRRQALHVLMAAFQN